MYHNYHKRYAAYKKLWNLKRYCSDDISLVENYSEALADNFKGWCIHHRLEFTLDGELALTSKELKRLGMYYNRPHFELIFMTTLDHRHLHNEDSKRRGTFFKGTTGMLGHKHTEESKRKMRDAKLRKMGVKSV